MNAYFLCDANSDIGFGHFFRCIALADELKLQGTASCIFLMRAITQNLSQLLSTSGHSHVDITKTKDLPNSISPKDWLIVDHYTPEKDIVHRFQSIGTHILEISDDENCRIPCAQIVLKHGALVDVHEQFDLQESIGGPSYKLLRREFHSQNNQENAARSAPKVIVMIGATDPNGVTLIIAPIVSNIFGATNLTVVTTDSNPHINAISRQSEALGYQLEVNPSNLIDIYLQSNLVVTSAGTAIWEAAATGLCCYAIQTHALQWPIIEHLEREGAIDYLGDEKQLDTLKVESQLSRAQDAQYRQSLAKNLNRLCDGKGAQRIAQIILRKSEVSV